MIQQEYKDVFADPQRTQLAKLNVDAIRQRNIATGKYQSDLARLPRGRRFGAQCTQAASVAGDRSTGPSGGATVIPTGCDRAQANGSENQQLK